jgi:uncharacterized protein (TIGR00730 family)
MKSPTTLDISGIERATLDEAVDSFLGGVSQGAPPLRSGDLLRALLRTVARLARDEPDRLDLKLMTRTLREMRAGFQTFAPYRAKRKIAVFGSARTRDGSAEYEMAHSCAAALVEAGFMVVTGAGPGIMEAANRGAGRESSFGVNIQLPFEQQANAYIHGDPKLATFKYFFTRKLVFVKETDGVILFPGGFGTMDECFEALTLIQTGKSVPAPIVMVEPPGSQFWLNWDRFVRDGLLAQGLISQDDMRLYRIVRDVKSAVDLVSHFYANYHSIRYVRDDLLIRVRMAPTLRLLDELNEDFSDIVKEGRIEPSGPAAEERGEAGVADLHRIRFRFNQRHFGRLRQLIDRLNHAVSALEVQTLPRIPPVHVVTARDEEDG